MKNEELKELIELGYQIEFKYKGKKYSIYSLRHSYISSLLRNGVALQAVAKIAGHASISTTLKCYTYATSEDIKKAGETLNDMFLPVANKDNKSKTELAIEEYKKIKEDMKRKGFTNIDEYYDYLEFMNKRKIERNNN